MTNIASIVLPFFQRAATINNVIIIARSKIPMAEGTTKICCATLSPLQRLFSLEIKTFSKIENVNLQYNV